MTVQLNLLVLRCRDIEASMRFYSDLGFFFTKEKHGSGVEHYAAETVSFVFELYPLQEGESADRTRLGFQVIGLQEVVEHLRTRGATVREHIGQIQGKLHVIAQDPDERKVELSQSPH